MLRTSHLLHGGDVATIRLQPKFCPPWWTHRPQTPGHKIKHTSALHFKAKAKPAPAGTEISEYLQLPLVTKSCGCSTLCRDWSYFV